MSLSKIAEIFVNKALEQLSGIILVWSGALEDVPEGWLVCDGTLGTPDLRNKFVPGASLTYAPDDTGGASFHAHVGLSNGHHHHLLGGGKIFRNYPYGDISSQTTTNRLIMTTANEFHIPPLASFYYIKKI